MSEENPTAGDSGASTEDQLVAFFAAERAAKEPPKEAKPEPARELEKAIPDTAATDSEEPKEGVTEPEKQPQITTADLAKVLGIEESALDVDGDGNVNFRSKIDGKDGAAKLADLLKDYQIRGHAENKSREAAEAVKAAEARRQEVEQIAAQKLAHVEQLATVAANELMREYQSIDWNALRQSDPGQYAALQQDFQQRKGQIAGVFQSVQQQNAQKARDSEARQKEYLKAEAERLPQIIPEWKDQAVAQKDAQEIMEWGRKVGYTAEQLQALNNSSALHVSTVRKAMLFDKLQSSKPAIENKVRLAPKIVKAGTTEAEDGKAVNLRNLKEKVTKTGGKNGSLEAYLIAAGLA